MSFIWFLFSLLMTALVYLRLSRRIGHLNLELSENLKNEIITLIAEFNQSAERNITLMEDRIHVAKAISEEITEKLSYMKKLKETLEREIKEAELKLKNIVTNEKAVVKPDSKQKKNVITKTYKSTQLPSALEEQQTKDSSTESTQSVIQEKVTLNKETPNKDINEEKIPSDALSEEKRDEEKQIAAPVEEATLTEKIILLARSGNTIPDIVQKLQISRGEVELVLKFSGYQSLLDS